MSAFVTDNQEDANRRGRLSFCADQRSYSYFEDVVSLGLDKKDVDSIFGDLSERRAVSFFIHRGVQLKAPCIAMRRINRSDCHSKVASRLQAICGGGENNAADVIGESDKSASDFLSESVWASFES